MIAVELRKLFGRPRTWVSIALLCLVPTIVAVLLALTDIGPRPGEGPPFLAQVIGNGSLYPAAALAIVLPVFLPVAVSVVAGESIAGEAAAGTLRYLLVRPVGRTRLLVAKLVSVMVYVIAAVLTVSVVAYAAGRSLLGTAPATALTSTTTTTLSGTPLSTGQLAIRTLAMIGFIAWSMMGVAAVSFFLSTVTDSALAAAMGGLAALVTSTVLVTLDAADSLRDYLPTRYWLAWVDLFRDPILWHDVWRGVAVQGAYVVVFLVMAWANFTTRDITS